MEYKQQPLFLEIFGARKCALHSGKCFISNRQ